MHLPPLIQDLAVILSVAALATYIFHKIRQPVVLGYIVSGLIVGPYTPPFHLISDIPSVRTWAELGVVFLMFTLGLEFSFRRLARVGAPVIVTGLVQVALMIALGFGSARAFGWPINDAVFLGCMIAISSTTIIIKALTELKLTTRRFAEFVFGILIVEDLVAIVLLVALSSFAAKVAFSAWDLVKVTGQLILVVGSWFLIGYFLIPRFVKRVGSADNEEMMTILSSGLCLLLVTAAVRFGYSPALGAFIMGSILAETRESERIERLVRPLRDLFAAVFFVSIGMLVDPRLVVTHWAPILAITLIVIVGKVMSLMFGSLMTGQSPRSSVQIAFSMGQIGEFSFIIATLGANLKVISPFLYPIIVAVSVITTFTTPYLIRWSDEFAHRFDKRVSDSMRARLDRHARLFGASRSPTPFWKSLGAWTACAVILVALSQVANDLLAPLLAQHWTSSVSNATAWCLAMLVASPFVWAMLVLFRKSSSISLLISRILTLGILAYTVTSNSISFTQAFAWAVTATLATYLLLNRRLEAAYLWFERQFLATFAEKDHEEHDFKRLVPWDVRLARFKVSPDSPLTGLTLQEAKLRESFGLNIVAIRRGHQVIVAPTRHDRVLPYDDLLGLGTEEHLEQARVALEHRAPAPVLPFDLAGYELRPLLVREGSLFAGRSILESSVHEVYGGLVVGIERASTRILNPASNFEIRPGDLLLVVGERERLIALQKKLG